MNTVLGCGVKDRFVALVRLGRHVVGGRRFALGRRCLGCSLVDDERAVPAFVKLILRIKNDVRIHVVVARFPRFVGDEQRVGRVFFTEPSVNLAFIVESIIRESRSRNRSRGIDLAADSFSPPPTSAPYTIGLISWPSSIIGICCVRVITTSSSFGDIQYSVPAPPSHSYSPTDDGVLSIFRVRTAKPRPKPRPSGLRSIFPTPSGS